MKRTCPKCDCSIWVIRPHMPFGMHRPILLFGHKPTIQEIDAIAWPVRSKETREAFMRQTKQQRLRRRQRRRGRKS